MSKYTTEVRFICETMSGLSESQGANSVDEIINKAREKIFDFSYPIFDEEYRSVLEVKILKHFYTREIGAETYGLWKMWLNERMNLIMPYYNQLYNSQLIEFNPLNDVDITTTHDGSSQKRGTDTNSGTSTSTGSTKANNDSWNYYSDTPQGGITGVASNTYLTNASHDTSADAANSETKVNTNSTGNSTVNNTDEYIERITGKRSGTSYSNLLKEYRETFLNIDMQIIEELNDLFMNLW